MKTKTPILAPPPEPPSRLVEPAAEHHQVIDLISQAHHQLGEIAGGDYPLTTRIQAINQRMRLSMIAHEIRNSAREIIHTIRKS